MIPSLSRRLLSRTAPSSLAYQCARPAAATALHPRPRPVVLAPSPSRPFSDGGADGETKLGRDAMVDILCNEYGLKIAESKRILNTVFDTIMESVANRETVTITGFGKFTPIETGPREYQNPSDPTKKVWKEATTRVKFTPYKHFKDCVAEGRVANNK